MNPLGKVLQKIRMALHSSMRVLDQRARAGFLYRIEVIDASGRVVSTELVKNIMPTESLNHWLSVVLKGGTQYSAWYIGLFEGDYTPVATDTAAAFPTDATEYADYSEDTREALTLGTIASGAVSNSASLAEFTFTESAKIYGGFISSSAAKSSTSGVLLSAVRFSSPKTLASGDTLRVSVAHTLSSL